MKVSFDLVCRGARVSATDDSAPVTGWVSLISHHLHMLPIKIRHVGTWLAKSTHLVTLFTSADKTLNACSTEEGERTVGRGRKAKRNIYVLAFLASNLAVCRQTSRHHLVTSCYNAPRLSPCFLIFLPCLQHSLKFECIHAYLHGDYIQLRINQLSTSGSVIMYVLCSS